MKKEKMGLVISGGGGKGGYFIGVWKALKEFGVDQSITHVSGTSVGALNGALFVQNDYDKAYELWDNLEKHDEIFKSSNLVEYLKSKKFDNLTSKELLRIIYEKQSLGVLSSKGLKVLFDDYLKPQKIRDSGMDFFVACKPLESLMSRKVDYFNLKEYDDENMKKILLASASIPVLFDPEVIDIKKYIDGAVNGDNCPIKPLYDSGVRKIIVVHLSRDYIIEKEKFPGLKCFEMMPQDDLGGLLSGTLDVSNSGFLERFSNGYKDAENVLESFFSLKKIGDSKKSALDKLIASEREFLEKRNENERLYLNNTSKNDTMNISQNDKSHESKLAENKRRDLKAEINNLLKGK